MIVALNMSNEPRTIKLSDKELDGEGRRLRLAIGNQRPGAKVTVEAGQVTLAPYEAMVFEITGK
jgi:hypothetical protein